MTLSSRISSLTGPDRAVDAEVAVAIGCVPAGYAQAVYHGKGQPFWWHDTDEKSPYWIPPAFTASLDAAMSAVPEGWGNYWSIRSYRSPLFVATIGAFNEVSAATPEIALLSAAMMARGL